MSSRAKRDASLRAERERGICSFRNRISPVVLVALGVLSNWIYDRLKAKKITRIRVNRVEIEVTPDGLKRCYPKRLA